MSAAALLLAACGGGEGDEADTGGEDTAGTTDAGTADGGSAEEPEGPLQIGGLLPQTGAQASAVEPLIAAVEMAIDEINEAGGVFGQDVEYQLQDATSDNDTALPAAESLISWGADVIVGPYGSGMASAVVEPITGAGVLMSAGSNTSSALTGISPLYFRTAPTDALEAAALADLLVADGHTSAAIIWQNDAWGAAFEEHMVDNLEAAGIEITANESFNTTDTDYTAQVSSVVASDPDAVIFLSYTVYTGAMVEQLVGTNGFPSENVYFSSSTLGEFSEGLSDQAYLTDIQAFQPGADPENQAVFEERALEINPDLTGFAYAASTYDAAIIAALGALAANSTEGEEIATVMREISGSEGDGQQCTSFADCKELLEAGETIDYDGLTGGIAYDENGDMTQTNYIHYQYGEDGTYTIVE